MPPAIGRRAGAQTGRNPLRAAQPVSTCGCLGSCHLPPCRALYTIPPPKKRHFPKKKFCPLPPRIPPDYAIIPPLMLVVAGENIADILPGGRAVPGGAALNAARAAGRLGAKVAYLTPLSVDPRGRMLRDALVADGVKILPEQSPKPCSLAEVSVDENGKPAYAFSRDGTADADFAFADLPPLPETAAVLHLVGALAAGLPRRPRL